MKTSKTQCAVIERRYLDVKSTARYLGATTNAIYAAVARRQIPYRRFGRKLVFDRLELDVYVKALDGVTVEEAIARLQHGGTVR